MPPKKAKKSARVWVSVDGDLNMKLLVPSWKVDQYPIDRTELSRASPGGYILDDVLHVVLSTAHVVTALPNETAAIYLHPDTMKQCNIKIAQPVLIATTGSTQDRIITLARPWPLKSLELDRAICSKTTTLSIGSIEEGSIISVENLPRSFCFSTITDLVLTMRSKEIFPLNETFKNYLLVKHEGLVLCQGSHLCVTYHGLELDFIVDSMTLTNTADISCIDTNLSLDLSGLSISSVTPMKPVKSAFLPVKSAFFSPQPCTSTPETKSYNDSSIKEDYPLKDILSILQTMLIGKVTMATKIHIKTNTLSFPLSQSLPSLSNVGGLEKQIQSLRELLAYPLSNPSLISSSQINFPHGFLLHGPSGTGKTLLAQALLHEAGVWGKSVNAADILMDGGGRKLKQVFIEAKENAPSLVIINDIDMICPVRDIGPTEVERQILVVLMKHLDSISQGPSLPHMAVIATTNKLSIVDSNLRKAGRFDREVEIPPPNGLERKVILSLLLQNICHSLNESEVDKLAQTAYGHVGADLKMVCQEAQYIALRRSYKVEGHTITNTVCVDYNDMKRALSNVCPSAMKEMTVEVPKVQWNDIGGESEIKQKLKEAVEWPLTHPEVFTRMGIQPPRGVLLYGPPGCSKTMIARALATESGLNFISVKGPELFSKWVGDSERAVRQVFSRARGAAPSIIFFDEIDALATHRQGEGSKVSDRVLAQLLTEMDGVETLEDVLIVAATNRPDLIDKALIRPGRIDRHIYVPLPNDSTRSEILKLQFLKTPVDKDVDINSLVQLTHNFSGAEVVALVQEAALCSLHEDMNSMTVCKRHFEDALKIVKPQTDMSMITFYENYSQSLMV